MKTLREHVHGARIISLAVLALMLVSFPSIAQDAAQSIAVALSVKGDVEVNRDSGWDSVALGTVFNDGDQIRTGDDGFCALIFTDDKSQVKLRPNTNVTLNAERNPDYSLAKKVNMEIGELFTEVKQMKGSLQVATPTAVASVKGTEFWVIVDADGTTRNITIEGVVDLLSILTGNREDIPAGRQGDVDLQGNIQVSQFDADEVPDYLDEMDVEDIEIKFIDEEGNEKTLIIKVKTDNE